MKEDFFVVCSQPIYFLTIAIERANENKSHCGFIDQMYTVDSSSGGLIRL